MGSWIGEFLIYSFYVPRASWPERLLPKPKSLFDEVYRIKC